jgi:hypothetical protein
VDAAPARAENGAVLERRKNPLRMKKNPFTIDAEFPPGPARYGVIAMMVVGALVALLVPVVFAVMLAAMLRGE